ncbi:hypothetical protein [Hymenobacter properus]|uniref:Uncharacterized protein n=1 Tax=Hymenobacter properus TaxID=2791026 RepID=A0A931FJE9_9BACT|nr:hypothetical protein [Hymenobacter properus]MBF9141808.1 hypothetical protein [Hymenobacter properus]MBR7720616.1 hypothetical protein [Microvirga sp. SRT04]
MKKTKKKKADKKATLLGGAGKSLKKLGKRKLSTGQKVLAGAALAAIGLGLIAKRRNAASSASEADATTDANAAEQNLAAMDANA